jgi:hypothetical protein
MADYVLSSKRQHAYLLYVPTELYIGLIKKMADLEIGKGAAILDSLNNSLMHEGFIEEKTFRKYHERYRRRLIDIVEFPMKMKAQNKTDRERGRERTLTAIFNDWGSSTKKAREYAVKHALENPEWPISKLILKKTAGSVNTGDTPAES